MENRPEHETSPDVGDIQSEASAPPVLPKKSDNTMAMLCHLLAFTALLGVPFGHILGPLVMWLIKRDEDPLVDFAGKESLNFQISVTIVGVALFLACLPLALIPFLGMILIPLTLLAGLALMVGAIAYTVIAAIKTSEGVDYRYPYTFRFIK